MPITFTQLVDDIEYQLGYLGPGGGLPEFHWERSIQTAPWALQALQAFPLLKPKRYGFTMIASTHNIELPSDFVEMMSVELPAAQEPPVFLFRLNYLEKGFYNNKQVFYDVDRNYLAGEGYVMIISRLLVAGDHIHINYMTYHDHDLLDNSTDEITVPDQYEDILITYVVAKAYRELMSIYVVDPTAHEALITEMVDLISQAEDKYAKMIEGLLSSVSIGNSAITPNRSVDKYDRVY